MDSIEFEGKTVKPTKGGVYHCPYNCSDPGYPRKKWKTEKGFRKHMEKCPNSPSAAQRKLDEQAHRKAESDAKAQEAMKDCPHKIGDTVFYVREIITSPTHKHNGQRMVRVRYEAKKRFQAETVEIKRFGFDYSLYANDGIRLDNLCETMQAAEAKAVEMQAGYDEHCEFSARCRLSGLTLSVCCGSVGA
jgi:hypothetical protein